MSRTKKASPAAAGISHNAYDSYIKELEEKVAMYESSSDEPKKEIVISQTDYIRVMSLLPYRLNLCTRERGQGKIYRFDTLFQIKRIIYSDLVDIMEANRQFLENGYFIILSEKVVRLHGLDDVYKNILTKEQIEKILEGTDEAVALYTSAGEKQKEVIIDLFVDKLVNTPNAVDLNLIDKLSRLSKVDISKKAKDNIEILNVRKEAAEESKKE
jgi:hypothetical protein